MFKEGTKSVSRLNALILKRELLGMMRTEEFRDMEIRWDFSLNNQGGKSLFQLEKMKSVKDDFKITFHSAVESEKGYGATVLEHCEYRTAIGMYTSGSENVKRDFLEWKRGAGFFILFPFSAAKCHGKNPACHGFKGGVTRPLTSWIVGTDEETITSYCLRRANAV